MLYILCDIGGPILGKKIIQMPWGVMLASSIFSALVFVLSDIIAEVYGYKIARLVFFSSIAAEISIGILTYFILSLHSPPTWQGGSHYAFIFNQVPLREGGALIASIIAWRINLYLLLRWKILMCGKSYWLRSMGSSIVGTILFVVIASPNPYLLGITTDFKDFISVNCWSLVLRISLIIMLAIPNSVIVSILKIIENTEAVNAYQDNIDFDLMKGNKT